MTRTAIPSKAIHRLSRLNILRHGRPQPLSSAASTCATCLRPCSYGSLLRVTQQREPQRHTINGRHCRSFASDSAQTAQVATREEDTAGETSSAPPLQVSENAARQLNAINKKANTNKMLRVTVESGGCHGFQYKMELTTQQEDDDLVFERDGAKVITDTVSLDLIGGSTLDYVEELIGSSFRVVDNPKAESSCGCKTSFNIKF